MKGLDDAPSTPYGGRDFRLEQLYRLFRQTWMPLTDKAGSSSCVANVMCQCDVEQAPAGRGRQAPITLRLIEEFEHRTDGESEWLDGSSKTAFDAEAGKFNE